MGHTLTVGTLGKLCQLGKMGIYLTQVTTTCSVSGGGRLSARFAGAGASLFDRGGLPGVFVSTPLAGRILLPTLRGSEGLWSQREEIPILAPFDRPSYTPELAPGDRSVV